MHMGMRGLAESKQPGWARAFEKTKRAEITELTYRAGLYIRRFYDLPNVRVGRWRDLS